MKYKFQALIAAATMFLGINALAANENLTVGDIKVTHLSQLPSDLILSNIPVKSGQKYSNKDVKDIYLSLKRLDYIFDVNVYPKIEGNTVNFEIEVDEKANALEIAKRIQEKERLKIKTEYVISNINFEGLKTINKEDVKKVLTIKEGDYLTPQEAIDGVEKIFKTGNFETVDIKMDRNADNTVTVNYIVKENPVITKVKIEGNSLFSEEDLIRATGIQVGKILNGNLLNPDENGILNYYKNAGYNLARIETISLKNDGEIVIELSEGIVSSVSFKKRSTKTDGQRAKETDTKLRTQQYIFDRVQAVKVGQIYQASKVEETIKELYRTGLFTSIEPQITGSQTDPNVRNIEFIVTERPTTTINGSISYGTEIGLVGEVKLADSNFRGKGQEALASLSISNKGNKVFELSLWDPWIKGTKRLQGGGSIYYREIKNSNVGQQEVEKVKKMGTKWTIGKGLNSNIYVRTSARLENYKEYYGNGTLSDQYNLFAVNPSLIYDTRNDSYNPTKGTYATVNYEVGNLFSRKNIRGEKGSYYQQIEADLRAYHTTFFKDRNVMAYRVVWGTTSAGTPEAFKFSVGGSDTIRGYESNDFEGYDKFHATIENRTKINNSLQFVAFFDIGNAWQKSQTVTAPDGTQYKKYSPDRNSASSFKDLKKGYGIGLRVETPMGPLRFDYAWPMDPVVSGGQKTNGKFYFSFGQTF